MLSLPTLLSTVLLSQTSPSVASPAAVEQTATERAAAAAERAAAAAERAAEANARTAQALERLAEQLSRAGSPAVAPPVPPVPPAPATPPASKAAQEWDITVGLGLIFLTGNASTVTFNGLVSAERKTEHWIYSVKGLGVYGESRPPTLTGAPQAASQVTALNAGLQLRGDRRFSEKISGYLLASAETDHVTSVEFRGSGEAGVGIIWWDLKRSDGGESFLRTDLAFRYGRERRFQYYPTPLDLPDVSLGGPRFGVVFRYGLTSDISFLEDLSVLPSLIEGSRLLVNSQTQLTVKLTKTLAIATTFLVQSDSQPAEGKLPTDTSLSVSATVNF